MPTFERYYGLCKMVWPCHHFTIFLSVKTLWVLSFVSDFFYFGLLGYIGLLLAIVRLYYFSLLAIVRSTNYSHIPRIDNIYYLYTHTYYVGYTLSNDRNTLPVGIKFHIVYIFNLRRRVNSFSCVCTFELKIMLLTGICKKLRFAQKNITF